MKKIVSVVVAIVAVIAVGLGLFFSGALSDLFPDLLPEDNTAQPFTPKQRVMTEQRDAIAGFQIKAVYLLPSDAEDKHDDTNGTIARMLNEANATLSATVGRTFAIDTANKAYDILFIRSSHNTAYFTENPADPTAIGMSARLLSQPGSNRKNFVFFVPVGNFKAGESCGTATMGVPVSMIAYTGQCKAQRSNTVIHEIFHNLGVNHVSVECDVMSTTGGCGANPRVDEKHTLYWGASSAGVDISTLRVWAGMTSRTSGKIGHCVVFANHLPTGVSRFATCPTGKQTIGDLDACWSGVRSTQLQQFLGGSWRTVANGKLVSNSWSVPSWVNCGSGNGGQSATVTELSAGKHIYRWVTNGRAQKQFVVYWQN